MNLHQLAAVCRDQSGWNVSWEWQEKSDERWWPPTPDQQRGVAPGPGPALGPVQTPGTGYRHQPSVDQTTGYRLECRGCSEWLWDGQRPLTPWRPTQSRSPSGSSGSRSGSRASTRTRLVRRWVACVIQFTVISRARNESPRRFYNYGTKSFP